MAALLHDFCPLIQRCLLIGEHNCCLLLQTEITSTRFLAVDRGLLDDSPLYVELDPPLLEFPDLGDKEAFWSLLFLSDGGLKGFVKLQVL